MKTLKSLAKQNVNPLVTVTLMMFLLVGILVTNIDRNVLSSPTIPNSTSQNIGADEIKEPAIIRDQELINLNVKHMEDNILYWLFVGLLVLTTVSMIIALRLILWRKALHGGQTSIVPDQLLTDFRSVDGAIHKQVKGLVKFKKSLTEYITAIAKYQKQSSNTTDEIKEALTVFQSSLTRKDAEIERLKKGADAEVFRRFLNRFVRLHHAIQEEIDDMDKESNEYQMLIGIQQLLEDALYECGVEQFEPNVGEHLTQAFGVADQKKIIGTNDQSLNLHIAEINKPGFILRTPEGQTCLQEARVTIYQFNKQESK